MTRSEIMKLAKMTENHLEKAREYLKRIYESGHPAAADIQDWCDIGIVGRAGYCRGWIRENLSLNQGSSTRRLMGDECK